MSFLGREVAVRERPRIKPQGGARPAPAADGLALGPVDRKSIVELARRMTDIDSMYREAAERMGQLYLFADSIDAHELTRRLDEPMRNAARNGLVLRVLLDELQACAQGPDPKARRAEPARRPRGER